MAQSKKFILKEETNFVEMVDGAFGIPSTLHGADGFRDRLPMVAALKAASSRAAGGA